MFENPMQMMQMFKKFVSQRGNIDPKQEVMKLVQSGQMSQQDLNVIQKRAAEFMNMFK